MLYIPQIITLISSHIFDKGVTALCGQIQIAKVLSIPHVVICGVLVIMVLTGYAISISNWLSILTVCEPANTCPTSRDQIMARLGVGLTVFTAYSTVLFVFSLMFMVKCVINGETESLIGGKGGGKRHRHDHHHHESKVEVM